jgi:hypothetical protein
MELAMTPIPTTSRFRSPLAVIVLALTWILTNPVPCAAADPAAFIANVGTQGIRALGGDVSVAERVARLRQLFRDDFDIPGIGIFQGIPGFYGSRAEQPAR